MLIHNLLDAQALEDHRLTQEPVEVAEQVSGASLLRRLTQEGVEGSLQVTGISLLRRLTQVVVEVPITQPVHPWAEQPFPEHPTWNPAFVQPPAEGQEHNYASFYGIHNKEIHLGRPVPRIKFVRR